MSVGWVAGLVTGLMLALLIWAVATDKVKAPGERRSECEARGGAFFVGGTGGDDVCIDPKVVR